jgi:hypothetical protein
MMCADLDIVSRLKESVSGEGATLESLGGLDAIIRGGDAIVASPFFDLLVPIAATASADERQHLVGILCRAFSVSLHYSVLRDGLDMVLDNDLLRSGMRESLVPILVRRISDRQAPGQNLAAAYALEALFQFALEHTPTRFRLMVIMSEFSAHEPPLFVEHAAKLAGAAYHQWREPALLKVLTSLQNIDGVSSEAAFELGMAAVSNALDAASETDILSGLAEARELFSLSLSSDPERQDAAAYLGVIDILQLISGDADAQTVNEAVGRLTVIMVDRLDLLSIGRVPRWLQPRCDREAEWVRLLLTVRRVAADLERPSWLRAASVLERVLSIYDSEHTVAIGKAVHQLFAPRIEGAFIRQRGLAAHLYDLLADNDWTSPFRSAAEQLRLGIARLEAAPRIEREGAEFPLLSSVLPGHAAELLPKDVAVVLEQRLEEHGRRRHRISNPVVQRIFAKLTDELAVCSDYFGEAKDFFDQLLIQILMFCLDRQDSDRRISGPRTDYLRRADATEQNLQLDLREFLRGNLPEAEVLSEVSGIAAGRTDLYVYFGRYRFIIELKKHEGVADALAGTQYRAQAVAYQATNVRLGFLGMLELLNRPGPPPTLEDCLWFDAYTPVGSTLPRYIVAFRVPGMLKTPSSLSK